MLHCYNVLTSVTIIYCINFISSSITHTHTHVARHTVAHKSVAKFFACKMLVSCLPKHVYYDFISFPRIVCLYHSIIKAIWDCEYGYSNENCMLSIRPVSRNVSFACNVHKSTYTIQGSLGLCWKNKWLKWIVSTCQVNSCCWYLCLSCNRNIYCDKFEHALVYSSRMIFCVFRCMWINAFFFQNFFCVHFAFIAILALFLKPRTRIILKCNGVYV